MRRSRILDGKEQQRSRAKLRKRLDRAPDCVETDEAAVDRLREHLSRLFPEDPSIAELERLDLNAYLQCLESTLSSFAPQVGSNQQTRDQQKHRAVATDLVFLVTPTTFWCFA